MPETKPAVAPTKPSGSVTEKQAQIDKLKAELAVLEAPEPVEYPKWMHHANGDSKVVNSKEEEDALDGYTPDKGPVKESAEDERAKRDAKIKAEAKVKAEAEAASKLAQGKPL